MPGPDQLGGTRAGPERRRRDTHRPATPARAAGAQPNDCRSSLHRLQRWGRPASIQRLRFRRVEEHGQAKRAAWGRQPVRLPLGTGALMLEKRSTEPSAL